MRLFLALELPGTLRESVAAAQARLRATETGWRWVRPEGVHVTLRFLGEVAEGRLAELSARFAAVVAGAAPAELEVSGLGAFPPRGRPRVLWIGLRERGGSRLTALAEGLEGAARQAGFRPEERAFSPHLTLARAVAGGRPSRPADAPQPLGTFRAEEVTLFRSVPGRGGAVYTVLARWPIGGALGCPP